MADSTVMSATPGHGQAEELVGLTVAAVIAGILLWLARRTLFPGSPSSTAR